MLNWFRRQPIVLTPDEIKSMKETCQSVAEKLRRTGRQTEAFSINEREWPDDIRERIAGMKDFDALLADHLVGAGEHAHDHKTMMWKFFAKMGFTPTSDIFDRIQDHDVIEIYNMDGDQIYRNLNYFDVVSLSVEDLVGMNWQREFKRNRKVTLHLIGLLFRFATGAFYKTYDCAKVPVHSVQELIAKRYLIELTFKYISPLKHNGKCVALVVGTNCRRLKP